MTHDALRDDAAPRITPQQHHFIGLRHSLDGHTPAALSRCVRNALVEALDRLTTPAISATATQYCPANPGSSRAVPVTSSSAGSGGCGGDTSSLSYDPGSAGGGGGLTDATRDYRGTENATIGMGDTVAGPYAALTMPATDFTTWSERNGYAVPGETRDAVRHYEQLSSNLLVLRLRPQKGVSAIQPVRVRFEGYVPTLPLRMIAAGVADKVGLSLVVLSYATTQAANFTNELIPESQIAWDFAAGRSNYRSLFDRAIRLGGGRVWVLETAQTITSGAMELPTPPTHDAGISDGGARFTSLGEATAERNFAAGALVTRRRRSSTS